MSNADELREILRENSLKSKDVAEIIDVSLDTVKSWLISSSSKRYRPMKDRDIDYLRLKLLEKQRSSK